MKRVNEGLYQEEKEILVDGRIRKAIFRVFRVRDGVGMLPYWAWDCPSIGLVVRDVHEKKGEAIQHMETSIKIGFKTLPVKSVMLDLTPLK